MARAKRKPTKPRQLQDLWRNHPTPEREAHNETESAGAARRTKIVLNALYEAHRLSEDHFIRLSYYRMQASQAEDDEGNESTLAPERIMGGGHAATTSGGFPKGMAFSHAAVERNRIERDLGSLRDVAKAICVDNMTLSRWCIGRFGGRERYDGSGNFIAIVPICEKRVMAMALQDLKYAAGAITLDDRR